MRKLIWVCTYFLLIAGALLIAHWFEQSVTTIAENGSVERGICIVIDAGHGGVDGGAISCTGKSESNFNLEIASRLNDLMQLIGYETKMIRTNDTSVYTKGETIAQKKISDLKERVRIVNTTCNALLISIHQNAFPEEKYSGAQVFYYSSGDSLRLAEQMQTALIINLNPESKRKIKKSNGIYLMEHVNCTGILIECGFISNRKEEAMLRNPQYQKKVCSVIAATVSSFLSNT